MPMACALMPMRPPSSAIIAILKPSFSSPSSAPAGTRHSANSSGTVLEPRRPILSSGAPTRSPRAPPSTRKHERPRAPLASGGRRARPHDEDRRPCSPPEIHCLLPRSTQSLAVAPRRGLHGARIAPGVGLAQREAPQAVPALRQDRAVAGSSARGVPKRAIASPTMFVTLIATAVDAQARATSCTASA